MKVLMVVLFVLFVVALAVWAAWAWWQERRRRRELAALGQARGLRLFPADPFDLPDQLFFLNLFTQGHSRLARNVLHGQLAGRPARLFDYQYETGSRKSRRTHRWQVAVVLCPELAMPGLLVQPQIDRDPLQVIFGFEDVPFQAEPFCRQFHVCGEDSQFAYLFLHAQSADLLAARPRVRCETQADALALYAPGPLQPAEAADLLELACKLADLMPPTLRGELAADAEAATA